MLRLQYVSQEDVLAFEMIVQRAFGERGAIGNVIHTDPGEPLAAEQSVGRIENALAGWL